MSRWAILPALLALSTPALLLAEPLALNEATPVGACSDPNDCGFLRGGVRYVSFEKFITRREVCAPAKWLLGAASRGDRLETVRHRLRRSGWTHVVAKRDGKGWTLSAGSKRDELKWIEVTFDARGLVKCVVEGLNAV
ncbi:MAG: hypothetical protein J7485_05515 [Sphingobium sp.]|nr:hypothetical protein [Sphingobium sp.]